MAQTEKKTETRKPGGRQTGCCFIPQTGRYLIYPIDHIDYRQTFLEFINPFPAGLEIFGAHTCINKSFVNPPGMAKVIGSLRG